MSGGGKTLSAQDVRQVLLVIESYLADQPARNAALARQSVQAALHWLCAPSLPQEPTRA